MREANGTLRLHRRNGFTIVDNAAIRDGSLSFRARGVLAWILSHSDDFKFTSLTVSAAGTEGRDAVRTALAELETHGYLWRERRRERGQWKTLIHIYECPSLSGKPDFQASPENTVLQASGDQALRTKDQEQDRDTSEANASEDGKALTPGQIADQIVKRFVAWYKTKYGNHPPETEVSLHAVIRPALNEFDPAEIKRALAWLKEQTPPRSVMKLSLWSAMEAERGRRKRPGQRPGQGGANDWVEGVAAVQAEIDRDRREREAAQDGA